MAREDSIIKDPIRFSSSLSKWYQKNKRILPWRENPDPYSIWVSEIMLQQTRVDQALPYYHRFISQFGSINALAAASSQQVLKAWEGLGYYSRARNMHYAAKQVMQEYGGTFPDCYSEIIKLKGIGPYTAAAISSIVFNEPKGVVDGNVIRVISRIYGIEEDIRRLKTKNKIQTLINDIIPQKAPGDFNQAMMELGALCCTPVNPNCEGCPVQIDCKAYALSKTGCIPYKSPSAKKPLKEIAVGIIFDQDNRVLIARRPENKMLGGLWEFPGGKVEENETPEECCIREIDEETGLRIEIIAGLKPIKHMYSHFSIKLYSFVCVLKSGTAEPKTSDEIKWVKPDELNRHPFPKANHKVLSELKDYLSKDIP